MANRKRTYVQTARHEQMEQTRARIVDAVMALHEEVGPSKTTIAAIAERSGVQRLTVYRHFPDNSALLLACSSRYSELNPPPDPSKWPTRDEPLDFVLLGLREIYDYYLQTNVMLRRVYRDAPEVPTLQEIMGNFDAYFRQIADDLSARIAPPKKRSATQLTLRHLIQFSTWNGLHALEANNQRKIGIVQKWIQATL